VCFSGREESLLQTLSAMEAERGVTGFRTTQDNLEKVVPLNIFFRIGQAVHMYSSMLLKNLLYADRPLGTGAVFLISLFLVVFLMVKVNK
jgi:hypothetical protein